MRFHWVAVICFALFAIIVPAILSAEVNDPYELRVFNRDGYANPYIDWLSQGRDADYAIYWGHLPADDPMDPFADATPIEIGTTGNVSIFDPTFQRRGLQVPEGAAPPPNGGVNYVLVGPTGGPESCGFIPSLGAGDWEADGIYEERRPGTGDMCDQIGRNPQSIGSCATDFVEPEEDQFFQRHFLENLAGITWDHDGNPATEEVTVPYSRCQNNNPKVILLTLSAMWCGPCQFQADTGEAFYQEYRDPDGDGNDDFLAIEVLIEDGNRGGGRITQANTVQWANANWATGPLTFPVIHDQNRTIWNPYNEGNSLPSNIIIGPDFVIDSRFAGWNEGLARSVIEQNICEIVPSGTAVGNTVCP